MVKKRPKLIIDIYLENHCYMLSVIVRYELIVCKEIVSTGDDTTCVAIK